MQKPQGAPTRQMSGRFSMKQTRQLGSSNSTSSFQNCPIGPKGSTFKNTQCIINSGLNGPPSSRDEYPKATMKKSSTFNFRSKRNSGVENLYVERIPSNRMRQPPAESDI